MMNEFIKLYMQYKSQFESEIVDSNCDILGFNATRCTWTFKNGYTASVIRQPGSYGYSEGLWEGAVMQGENVVYDTPITNDVLGYLDARGCMEFFVAVSKLPPRAEK